MDMSVSFNTLILNGRGCHSSCSWGAVTNLNTHFNSISLNNLRSLVTLPTLTLTDLKLNTWGIQWECRKWQMTGSRKKWTLRQFVLRPEIKLNNKKNLIWWNLCDLLHYFELFWPRNPLNWINEKGKSLSNYTIMVFPNCWRDAIIYMVAVIKPYFF